MSLKFKLLSLFPLLLVVLAPPSSKAQRSLYVEDEVIVSVRSTNSKKGELLSKLKATEVKKSKVKDHELWKVKFPIRSKGEELCNPTELAAHFANDPAVFVEPNYLYGVRNVPNDPAFSLQWGLSNTGQSITSTLPSNNFMDINAIAAWDITTSAVSVKVAVIDTGVDWTHPDLVNNIWQNLGEDADQDGVVLEWNGSTWIFDPGDVDGIDNDGNGFVDDFIGWDFANNDNNPFDDHGHGTHVAGILGARGNNGIGCTGIAWEVQIVPLKIMNEEGKASAYEAAAAFDYAVKMGLPISNCSWGGHGDSQLISIAIDSARLNNHLVVAAAGNEGQNIDSIPFYPACFPQENIISVSMLGLNSNYGAVNVDISAPGTNIYSTYPDSGYRYFTGTSMAAPHITGALALMLGQCNGPSYIELKSKLLRTATPQPFLGGMSTTGSLLDLGAALEKEDISIDFIFDFAGLDAYFNVVNPDSSCNYSWSFGDGGFTTGTDPTHIYTAKGNVNVCLTAENGCDALQICKLFMLVDDCFSTSFGSGTSVIENRLNYKDGRHLVFDCGRYDIYTGLFEDMNCIDDPIILGPSAEPPLTTASGDLFEVVQQATGFGIIKTEIDLEPPLYPIPSDPQAPLEAEVYTIDLTLNKTGEISNLVYTHHLSDTITFIGEQTSSLATDVAFLQMDIMGNIVANKQLNYGADATVVGDRIAEEDGSTTFLVQVDDGFYITNLDETGNVNTSTKYSNSLPITATISGFQKTADNGYLVASSRSSIRGSLPSLTKISATGTVVWAKNYLGKSGSAAIDIGGIDEADNIYAFEKDDTNSSTLLKLNSDGDLSWRRSITDAQDNEIHSISNVIYDRGYLFIAGLRDSPTIPGARDLVVIQTDSSMSSICSTDVLVNTSNASWSSTSQSPSVSNSNSISSNGDSTTISMSTNSYPNVSALCPGNCNNCYIAASFDTPIGPFCGENSLTFTNTTNSSGTVTYQWLINDELVDTTEHLNHNFIESGVYDVELRVEVGGCLGIAKSQVILNPSAQDFAITDFIINPEATISQGSLGDTMIIGYLYSVVNQQIPDTVYLETPIPLEFSYSEFPMLAELFILSISPMEPNTIHSPCADSLFLDAGIESMGFLENIKDTLGEINLSWEQSVGMGSYVWYKIDTLGQKVTIGRGQSIWILEAGEYELKITDRCGTKKITSFYIPELGADCVWPGDLNNDGITNNKDFLNLGFTENETLAPRPNATTDWLGQPHEPSNISLFASDLIYIDANGDGALDSLDRQPISENYNKTHDNGVAELTEPTPSDYQLTANRDMIGPAPANKETDTVAIVIEGAHNFPIEAYGIMLRYYYSGSKILEVNFDNSVFGTEGEDMITIYEDFPGEYVELAIVGTNGLNRDVRGELGNIISEVLNPVGDTTTVQMSSASLSNQGGFMNVLLIDKNGNAIPLGGGGEISSAQSLLINSTDTSTFFMFVQQDHFSCGQAADATVNLSGGAAPYTYLWDDGQTTRMASNLGVGNHQIVVTDGNGETISGSIDITEQSDFNMELTLSPATNTTDGAASVSATGGTGNFTYSWSNNPTVPSINSISGLAPGEYYVIVSDGLGCRKIEYFEIMGSDISLELKVILEGAYVDSTGLMHDILREKNKLPIIDPYYSISAVPSYVFDITGNDAIVDWLLVELREVDNKSTVHSVPALLQRDGDVVNTDGISPLTIQGLSPDNYYIVIRHRNHLPTISQIPIFLDEVTGAQCDFTIENTNLEPSCQKEIATGVWGLCGGNGVQNALEELHISGADRSFYESESGSFDIFHAADYNMDADITGSDKTLFSINNGRYSTIPID